MSLLYPVIFIHTLFVMGSLPCFFPCKICKFLSFVALRALVRSARSHSLIANIDICLNIVSRRLACAPHKANRRTMGTARARAALALMIASRVSQLRSLYRLAWARQLQDLYLFVQVNSAHHLPSLFCPVARHSTASGALSYTCITSCYSRSIVR